MTTEARGLVTGTRGHDAAMAVMTPPSGFRRSVPWYGRPERAQLPGGDAAVDPSPFQVAADHGTRRHDRVAFDDASRQERDPCADPHPRADHYVPRYGR